MAGKERNMKDEEYCVRFPLDFFDDARVKVIEAMPSGDTIICLWIRFLFLRVRAMDMDADGGYLLRCEDGRTLTEEELCRIPHTPSQATHYALSVLDRFGVVPSETEGAAR